MINEIAILVLAGVIGWEITIIYIVTGISVGILGGIFMEKFGWGQYLQDYLLNKKISRRGIADALVVVEDKKLPLKSE